MHCCLHIISAHCLQSIRISMFGSETQIMNMGVLTWMPVGRQSTATASSISRSRLNCFLSSTSVSCMSNIISRSTSPKIRTPPFRSASLCSGRGQSTSSSSGSSSPPSACLCACESQQLNAHNSVKVVRAGQTCCQNAYDGLLRVIIIVCDAIIEGHFFDKLSLK